MANPQALRVVVVKGGEPVGLDRVEAPGIIVAVARVVLVAAIGPQRESAETLDRVAGLVDAPPGHEMSGLVALLGEDRLVGVVEVAFSAGVLEAGDAAAEPVGA